MVQELLLGNQHFVGEGHLVEDELGVHAGDGVFAGRGDGKQDQGVEAAERFGEFCGEVAGTGIEVRLEDAEQFPAGEDVAD